MSIFWRPVGAVAWYDFAELRGNTLYDLSGYGNHGTLYGPIWKRGPLIGCLEFDGIDDYVEIPHSASLNLLERLSIEAVFRIDRLDVHQIIIDKVRTQMYDLHYEYEARKLRFMLEGTYIDSAYTFADDDVGRWFHVGCTWDLNLPADQMKIYINGKLDATGTKTDPLTSNTNPVRIGIDHVLTFPIDGDIALVRIYSRALTKREIEAHHRYFQKTIHLINPLVL